MTKKKQTEEELLQTHVLNLSEIRNAEHSEKVSRSKKIPVVLLVFGIICITAGFIYSTIIEYNADDSNTKDDKGELVAGINQEHLTCISEFHDESNNYKVENKIIYYFDNSKLRSSEMSTVISFTNSTDAESLKNLTNNYKNLYTNSQDITYNIYCKDNSLYFNSNIKDYNSFDISSYSPIINTINHTTIFEGGEKISNVKEKEISLGNSCS